MTDPFEPIEVIDLFEPATFEWDEDIYIARVAAGEFGETATGDY